MITKPKNTLAVCTVIVALFFVAQPANASLMSLNIQSSPGSIGLDSTVQGYILDGGPTDSLELWMDRNNM